MHATECGGMKWSQDERAHRVEFTCRFLSRHFGQDVVPMRLKTHCRCADVNDINKVALSFHFGDDRTMGNASEVNNGMANENENVSKKQFDFELLCYLAGRLALNTQWPAKRKEENHIKTGKRAERKTSVKMRKIT